MFDRSLFVFLIDKGNRVLITTTGVDYSIIFLHFYDLKPNTKSQCRAGFV